MPAQQQWDISENVGVTAVFVAAARAAETAGRDPLVSDPYADSLVQAAQLPLPLGNTGNPLMDAVWASMRTYVAVRSRFFDDYFRQACDNGVRQAVILASGLDTRAFRLQWPGGMRVFEIDQPKVLEFKDIVLAERKVQASSERHAVPVDLRDDWERSLLQAGFVAGQPTAWLAEGLLPYLPAAAEEQLIATVHRLSCAGSHLAIEGFAGMRSVMDNQELRQAGNDIMGMDVQGLLSEEERPDPADRLADLGWTVHQARGAEVATRYGRTLTWDTIQEGLNDMVTMLTAQL